MVKKIGFDDPSFIDQTGFRQTVLKYNKSAKSSGKKGSKVKGLWLLPQNASFANVAEEVIVVFGEVRDAVGQRSWVLFLALAAARCVNPKY